MELRSADMKDVEFVYNLRFSSEIVGNSWSDDKPSMVDHISFFKEHMEEYQIIGNRVGFLRVEPTGVVSICVSEKFRNRGVASRVLKSLYCGTATVKLDNLSSYYAFLNAGFKPIGWIMKKKIKELKENEVSCL